MFKKTFVLHPFLFLIFPLLFIYTNNIGVLSPEIIILPIIAGILIVLFLQIILSFIITSREKKGILISLFILMFFTYGLLQEKLQSLTVIQNHKYLLLIYGIIFFLSAFFLIRTKRNICVINKILNIAAISLIIMNVFHIITFELNKEENVIAFSNEQFLNNLNDKPNIYYIILDGYANSGIMKEFYKYDNSEFVNFLINKGFNVTSQSRSNYPETFPSLASSLNMTYLVGTNRPADGMLYRSIQNNKVMQLLKAAGYKTINISSNGYIENMKVADINIHPGSVLTNEYYYILFKFTMLKVLRKYLNLENLFRERILFTFSKLSNIKREITKPGEPLFVFAHIFPPHPPYLFGPSGEFVNSGFLGDLNLTFWGESTEYMKLYENQLIFVNKMMKKVINNIISNSGDNTIIIIQSDHGPHHTTYSNRYTRQMKIFNAILLPKGDENIFYNSITPVNTFRIIFNHYFKTHYNLLEDKSFYPEHKPPYKLLDVTKEISDIIVIK